MNDFYAGLKTLTSHPHWAVYEAWLDSQADTLLQQLLNGKDVKLESLRDRILEIKRIKKAVKDFVEETEANSMNKEK